MKMRVPSGTLDLLYDNALFFLRYLKLRQLSECYSDCYVLACFVWLVEPISHLPVLIVNDVQSFDAFSEIDNVLASYKDLTSTGKVLASKRVFLEMVQSMKIVVKTHLKHGSLLVHSI
jgi:hypothetical protein